MNRRRFLAMAGGAVTTALVYPQKVAAAWRCTGFNQFGIQECEVGVLSAVMPVTAQQEDSQWCWAACIEMVFRYYGYRVRQQRIVSDTWGSLVNMPGRPDQILANLNRPWIDDRKRKFAVMGDAYSANPLTAANDLSDNMPLIIGTHSHAVVLTAMRLARNVQGRLSVLAAMVRDPWPGRGRRLLTPQEWMGVSFAARIRVVPR